MIRPSYNEKPCNECAYSRAMTVTLMFTELRTQTDPKIICVRTSQMVNKFLVEMYKYLSKLTSSIYTVSLDTGSKLAKVFSLVTLQAPLSLLQYTLQY